MEIPSEPEPPPPGLDITLSAEPPPLHEVRLKFSQSSMGINKNMDKFLCLEGVIKGNLIWQYQL
jgi:hypothetical protein